MNSQQQLLDEIESFLITHAMPPGDFGLQVMSDISFVYRLRKGRDVRTSTADRARTFMREYKGSKRGPLAKRRATDSRSTA